MTENKPTLTSPPEPPDPRPVKAMLEDLREPPAATATSERWATIACYGTWNDRYSGGSDRDALTHVQRVYDLMPEPKFELEGLGKRKHLIGRYLGGAFGIGHKDRVERAIRWLDGHQFDRLLLLAHSRGAAVAGNLIRKMEKLRNAAWRRGENTEDMINRGESVPPWCRVECLVLLDPVLSMGFTAPAKWMTRFLPPKLKWHINWDRYRTIPAFVHVQVALYALDEERRAFEATHFRLTHPEGRSYRRWLPGVHSDIGGYGPSAADTADSGSWLRAALSIRVPPLRDAPWPYPMPVQAEWEEVEAAPNCRRALPGDLALLRRV